MDLDIIKTNDSIMLLDYYSASASAVGDSGHYELVLTSTDKADSIILDRYIKEDEDSREAKTSFSISAECFKKVKEYIQRQKIGKWNEENGISIDGGKIVLKYWDGGKYIRVSTENMPENGMEILYHIRNIIEDYILGK